MFMQKYIYFFDYRDMSSHIFVMFNYDYVTYVGAWFGFD